MARGADEFERAGSRILALVRDFKRSLSRRDWLMVRIGMRACHVEEALAAGDVARAEAHFRRLVQNVRRLG